MGGITIKVREGLSDGDDISMGLMMCSAYGGKEAKTHQIPISSFGHYPSRRSASTLETPS